MSRSSSEMSAAVVMRGYGAPEVLAWGEAALAPLQGGEVRIATTAAAVNFTDLKIRAGTWPIRKAQPFPYTPGVEVVGVIDALGPAVRGLALGQRVITMMQGLGGVRAERPGAYAARVTASADAVAPVPADLDPLALAALGLVAVTAYEGLRRVGPLAGRRVLVTGAAGGVGSAATAIARAQGAGVVALVSRAAHVDYVRSLGADEVIVTAHGESPRLDPESVDAVLDAVGGAGFGACVQALKAGGTLSLVGAVAGGDVAFDAWTLIRPLTLTGYSSESLDGAALREAVGAVCGWLRNGAIRAPEHHLLPLREAAEAHRRLERGGVAGRVLLVP